MTAGPGSPRHRAFTRFPAVEGYCWPQSVVAGDPVDVHCTSRADSFRVEVSRVGATRVTVWSRDHLRAADHEIPDRVWEAGCDWPVTSTITTDPDWPSGFYEVRFLAADATGPEAASEAFFVLRRHPRSAPKPGLVVLSTNTYNAYNQWGGACLYSGAHAVSFARPIERGYLRRPSAPDEVDFDGRVTNIADPSDPGHTRLVDYQRRHEYPLWSASSGWHNWERRFTAWAERSGYELDFAISSDLDRDAGVLAGHDLLLSVGHDEYWSWGMRDAVDGWVEAGGNWAILSGNTCFWQVRYEDDGRTMVCHKGAARFRDPVRDTAQAARLTSMWSDPLIGRPEADTIGLSFTRGGYHRIGRAVPGGTGAYTVQRPDHWLFADSGLGMGDELGRGSFIVGYEVDGCALEREGDRVVPAGTDGAPDSLEILATAPARLISITADRCEAPEALWASVDPPGDLEGVAMVLFGDASPDHVAELATGHAVLGTFSKGAGTVVHCGSADWAYGLDADPTVQRVTANILAHLTN